MIQTGAFSQGEYLQTDIDSPQYSFQTPRGGLNQAATNESFDESEIWQAVKSALKSNIFLKENNIAVRVDGGWVYLEGTVESEEQRNLAQKTVSEIFGVARVTNYLTYPRLKFKSKY
jgi:osmotically-inducible protein OsmY